MNEGKARIVTVRCRHCKAEQPLLVVGMRGELMIRARPQKLVRITGYYCEACGRAVRWGEREG